MATIYGKKKMTTDDLIKPPGQTKEAQRPKTDEELANKIARILGGVNRTAPR